MWRDFPAKLFYGIVGSGRRSEPCRLALDPWAAGPVSHTLFAHGLFADSDLRAILMRRLHEGRNDEDGRKKAHRNPDIRLAR